MKVKHFCSKKISIHNKLFLIKIKSAVIINKNIAIIIGVDIKEYI